MCYSRVVVGLLFLSAVSASDLSEKQRKRIYLHGDILLAGLSPIHYPPRQAEESKINAFSAECGGEFNIRGLQHAEAILFAVEKINANDTLLPGITLGVEIRDTCNSVDYAISEALHFQFIQDAYYRREGNVCVAKPEEKITETVAVVGAAYSGVSMAIASLSGLFYVPTVSYASTTRLLGNRARFKYFLRTVPSDTLQVEAMLGVVSQFGWNFVSTVASDTEYGRSGVDAFKSAAQTRYGICIAEDALFTSRTPKADVRRIISRIRRHPKARVLVLFAELNDALYFVETAKEENLTDYIWLGSDAFARSHRVLSGNAHILKYWLATAPQSRPYQPFREYFGNITAVRVARNPWLQQYEEEVRFEMNASRGPFEYSPFSSTAIDAVYAVAHGLHSMYGCTEHKCPAAGAANEQLYSYVRNVSFLSPTGHQVQFDAGGSSGSYYSVYFVNQTAADKFPILGHWHRDGGFHFSDDYMKSDRSLEKLRFLATCSSTCPPGYRKEPSKLFAECCWKCHRCQANSVSNSSNLTSCTPCKEGFKANSHQSACLAIEPTVLLDSTEAVAIICACVLGIAAVLATAVIFSRYKDSAVVKASSRNMSYILLGGLAWCFALPVLWLVQPTPLLCRMHPFLASSAIALVIGPLLTKTNRIARIFSLNTMRTGRAPFLSNKWQMAFTVFCFLLENAIAATWILVSPSKPEQVPNGNEEVLIECQDESLVGVAIWATFNAGLFLLCTYQAFLVRKVPENYNEAKFIAFTMVTICISAGVYVPTYFGTQGQYKKVLTCFLVVLCSAASLVCLFGPKLYIIVLRPAKNRPLPPRLDPTTADLSYRHSFPCSALANSQVSLGSSTSYICDRPNTSE